MAVDASFYAFYDRIRRLDPMMNVNTRFLVASIYICLCMSLSYFIFDTSETDDRRTRYSIDSFLSLVLSKTICIDRSFSFENRMTWK